MLIIHCKDNYLSEREYIYDVVFNDFWGVDYQIKFEDRKDLLVDDGSGNSVLIEDIFFQMKHEDWLTEKSLPFQPLFQVTVPKSYQGCVTNNMLPIIYGAREYNSLLFSEDSKKCYLDIFGSAFFMLTRYEEVVKKDRDNLDRFPAVASLAYQEGFLERPIVNEYLEILWQWLSRNFTCLKRKMRSFSVMPTHDVDYPFWNMAVAWPHRLRILAGDVLKRHDFDRFITSLGFITNALMGRNEADPYNTFDMIMDLSEANNLTSHFYFMTAQGRNDKDGNYDVMHPEIRNLVKKILTRGHKIGIHPGFGSKETSKLIKEDVDKIRLMIERDNYNLNKIGGRQHYLHWSAPYTWQYYDQAGIEYDTTLGYADHIGFRCGICYDFPVYNVITHERYKLREYPLTVMERSGLGEGYMNLSHEEMLVRCLALKDKVMKYRGTFVILWHNTSFITDDDVECYKRIVNK